MTAKIIDPATGALTSALGSHRCNENAGSSRNILFITGKEKSTCGDGKTNALVILRTVLHNCQF